MDPPLKPIGRDKYTSYDELRRRNREEYERSHSSGYRFLCLFINYHFLINISLNYLLSAGHRGLTDQNHHHHLHHRQNSILRTRHSTDLTNRHHSIHRDAMIFCDFHTHFIFFFLFSSAVFLLTLYYVRMCIILKKRNNK